MNILVIQESDWLKRNPHQQHHLMELLALKGNKIHIIDYEVDWKKNLNRTKTPRRVYKNVSKVYKTQNITVIRPPLIKKPILSYLSIIYYHKKEIKHQIETFQPDVIIGFGILNTNIAAKEAKKHDIPFVYYFIDVLHDLIPEKIFRWLGKQITKNTIKHTSYTLTINQTLNEKAQELGADPYKSKIINAGINLKHFDNRKHTGKKVKEYYNIKDNDLTLFFMGWLYQFAGLKELATEIGQNQDKYPNIKLLIVGDGDAYDDLKEIQERYDLEKKVILTGKQKYKLIPEFIAASDICILPAYIDEPIMQEIVPIKLYEYLAMHKPVIATKLPGIETEFGHNAGITYINKPEEVLKIIKNKFNNNKYIKVEGEKGFNFVKNNDWATLTIEFENILEELVLNTLLSTGFNI
ncbi:MAG: glycosyltransferase [Methanobacteriaceae archaeon]|nr:glycosyltransferase [Methanobacteriaceae archaeon]